jgi:hypothetical protein
MLLEEIDKNLQCKSLKLRHFDHFLHTKKFAVLVAALNITNESDLEDTMQLFSSSLKRLDWRDSIQIRSTARQPPVAIQESIAVVTAIQSNFQTMEISQMDLQISDITKQMQKNPNHFKMNKLSIFGARELLAVGMFGALVRFFLV